MKLTIKLLPKRLACMALLLLASAASAHASPTLTVLDNPPVPGLDDQSQMSVPPSAQQPPGLNYYVDQGTAPGQIFTTGNNPSGYTLTSLALYNAGNSGGNSVQTYNLSIFTINGSTATPFASYVSASIPLTDSKWFQWTGLNAILQPNTQYAYAMHGNSGGWKNLGNVSGDLYAGGQIASIPIDGGTMIFSTDASYDASFDVGLLPTLAVTVAQPVFSSQTVFPGTTVTASATVGGPTPYSYQWQTDGGSGGTLTNIPNATSATLSVDTTGMAFGNYLYDLVVTNATSSATSSTAGLSLVSRVGIPGVIGIKFGFTGGYSSTVNLDPADQAGVVPVMNWNNLLANVLDPNDRGAAINIPWSIPQDSAGNALSGVTLTPAGFNDGWHSGGTDCSNAKLLYNFWKWNASNGTSDGTRSYVTLTIANLPGSTYDVYLYVNNNNGNYWGNAQANSVFAVGSDLINYGFNGDSIDPISLNPQLHTASGYGSPVNYVKMPYVATTSGGVITITAAVDIRTDFGLSGVELVPSADIILKQDILPSYAETSVGDKVAFTAAFASDPAVNLQWQKISGGVTNNINTGVANVINNGVVTSTLTLNDLQLTDSGSYLLQAVKADNSADVAYSTAASLVVSNSPTPVNNVLVNVAGQTFTPGAVYYPWAISTDSLISGFQPTASGAGSSTPAGDFTGSGECYNNPAILSDGVTDIASPLTQGCAGGPSGGTSITYTFDTSSATYGFEITNILVFGGWNDHGRDQQDYEVQYSTVAAPTTFFSLLTVNYNPSSAVSGRSVTRTMLVPATGGTLMHNVAALKINFDVNPAPKNGWEGYSEIVVAGGPSPALMPSLVQDLTPQTAVDVAGSQLVMQASFLNYTSLQWQHDGTIIPGATSAALTLNNLQLSDSGDYTLVASNASGSTLSSVCAVTVNPVPAATNNAVISFAAQTSPYSPFTPTWDPSALASSLIHGAAPTTSGDGDFTFTNTCGGPAILTDGTFGVNDFSISGTDLSFTAMGSDTNVGNYVTYTLPPSQNGYDITNIVTAAGWNDGGRDMLACTVYYATTDDPAFVPLAAVSYNPESPSGVSFDKATITPASGVLARNVVALKFDMTAPVGENGWSGYSEISVHGTPSVTQAPGAPPTFAAPVVSGTNFIMTGTGGTPNRGYTWLSSTNLLTPAADWKVVSTGTLDGAGALSNALPVNSTQPATFFRLRMP